MEKIQSIPGHNRVYTTTSFNFINFFASWTINTTQFRHAEFQDECKVEGLLLAMISRSLQSGTSNYPSENLAGSRRPIFSQQFLYTIYTSGARGTGPFALASGHRRLSASALSERGAAGRVATSSSIAPLAGELQAQEQRSGVCPAGLSRSLPGFRPPEAAVGSTSAAVRAATARRRTGLAMALLGP
jgi:hypothetical protein